MREQLRTQDGKRLRGTQEWLKAQGDDPVAQFRIFDPDKEIVLEGWKNTKTKGRLITKMRRPVGAELTEFRTKAETKGMNLVNAKRTKEIIDRKIGKS